MLCLNFLVEILLMREYIQLDNENLTNDQKLYHDELVQEAPLEPLV